MENITIYRSNARNIRFIGEKIASVSSSPNNACSNYSGATGYWTSLRLYQTASGVIVCEKIEHTQWIGEKDHYSGKVCKNVEEVIDFFGYGWLAKDLYDESEIDAYIKID